MDVRHLLSIAIQLDPPVILGAFPLGERRLITFRSGSFDGLGGLQGSVAPGGLDWQLVRSDGTIEIRAHYLLRTDRDEAIEITSDGLRVAAPEVASRLASGEHVEASEYYFRTHVTFATSAPRWDRLNRVIGVAKGERRVGDVAIHVYEVL